MNYYVHKNFLKKVAEKTLKILKIKIPEISIVLVDGNKIKELNRKYRKANYVTDVLAFDYGEIFICVPQAKKQAKELKHSLKEELAILLIHGILHLAGYDDGTKTQREKMFKEQNKILLKGGIWQKTI